MPHLRNFKIDLRTFAIPSFCLVVFIAFLIIYIGFFEFIKKMLGIILILIGLIITIKFPQPGNYQPKTFSHIFIIIGIFILLSGVYLLVF